MLPSLFCFLREYLYNFVGADYEQTREFQERLMGPGYTQMDERNAFFKDTRSAILNVTRIARGLTEDRDFEETFNEFILTPLHVSPTLRLVRMVGRQENE